MFLEQYQGVEHADTRFCACNYARMLHHFKRETEA